MTTTGGQLNQVPPAGLFVLTDCIPLGCLAHRHSPFLSLSHTHTHTHSDLPMHLHTHKIAKPPTHSNGHTHTHNCPVKIMTLKHTSIDPSATLPLVKNIKGVPNQLLCD